MFDNLSEKIRKSIKKVSGQSRISESNIEEAVRDIRLSLLEADVNFKVVKNFIDRVKVKALGAEVIGQLAPGQVFTKIVHDELVNTLGHEAVDIDVRKSPSVLMLVGLQGVGKTTTAGKLASYIRQKLGKRVGLVSGDIYRPAAMDQLEILAKQLNIDFFPSQGNNDVAGIARASLDWAKSHQLDCIIFDTAGRLQIDKDLMAELVNLKPILEPREILLVADAMLGQQAVNVAESFHKELGLTGLILTKVDGDARGGAALSIREVTGVPIKFLGTGENLSKLEVFHPDRLAKRILDMGDILSLVEKTQEHFDAKMAQESTQKMLKNEFGLDDFLKQIQQLKKMGGMESILKFLPGMGELSKQLKNMTPPDQEMKKIEAIIHSMTLEERRRHKILNASRRLRIAQGSGTQVQDVNKLIKQFEQTQKMMSQFMKMGMGRGMKMPF